MYVQHICTVKHGYCKANLISVFVYLYAHIVDMRVASED